MGNNLQKKTHSAPVMSECIVNTSPMYMFYFTRVIVLILGLAFSLLRHFWPHYFFFFVFVLLFFLSTKHGKKEKQYLYIYKLSI